jgi:hypothetical protein
MCLPRSGGADPELNGHRREDSTAKRLIFQTFLGVSPCVAPGCVIRSAEIRQRRIVSLVYGVNNVLRSWLSSLTMRNS